jgi:hypothetical protein
MIQQWMNRWVINRTKIPMSEIEFELQMTIVGSNESQLNLIGSKKGKRRHFMPN